MQRDLRQHSPQFSFQQIKRDKKKYTQELKKKNVTSSNNNNNSYLIVLKYDKKKNTILFFILFYSASIFDIECLFRATLGPLSWSPK
jgi:hypothetical protein